MYSFFEIPQVAIAQPEPIVGIRTTISPVAHHMLAPGSRVDHLSLTMEHVVQLNCFATVTAMPVFSKYK